jgi:hypothetical protein
MFEGEEENGSTGFRQALEANLGWFEDAALVVISNTVRACPLSWHDGLVVAPCKMAQIAAMGQNASFPP